MPERAIWIRCEGSGCPPNCTAGDLGGCAMCGQLHTILDDGVMPEHQRMDILAMLDRGDFDS